MPTRATNGRSASDRGAAAAILPAALAALGCAVAVVEAASGTVRAANPAWNKLVAEIGSGSFADQLFRVFPRAAEALTATAAGTTPSRHRAMQAATPPGGVATWWDLEMVPHPGQDGLLIVTARDVTEDVLSRRDAEATDIALSAVGARLGVAQEATGIGLWEWDLENDVQAWSPAQFRLFGLDPATSSPPPFADYIRLFHPDDRTRLVAATEAGFSGGSAPHHLECRISRPDTGEERWLLLLGRTVASAPDGRPRRLVGVSIDVTARRREQDALVASETRLRLAFKAAQMFAWDWQVQTGEVTWMDGLAKDVGLDDEGFGGTIDAFRALVHPEDTPLVEAALNAALAGRTPLYKAEFRMRRTDGSWRTTRTQGLVVRDDDGVPVRVIGVDHDITEQREAEGALRDSERRLRMAMQEAGLGAFEADLQSGQLVRDGTLSALLGLPREATEVSRDDWFGFVHPDDRQAVTASFIAAAGGGPQFLAEFRVIRRDGTIRLVTSRGVLSDSGHILGVVQDVTEAREASALLRESASRFRGMFDSIYQFVGLLSPDGTLLKANRASLEFIGKTREEVVGQKFWETPWFTATPGASEQVRRAVQRAAVGKFVRYHVELQGASRVATLDFSLRPVRDERGAVILLVPEGRDISDLRAAQIVLARNEARWRTIMDSLPVQTFIAMTDGYNDFVNQRWFDYSGQAGHEALGFGWAERLHPDDRARTLSAWDAARRTGDLYQIEHRLRGADGTFRWFLTRAVGAPDYAAPSEKEWFGGSVDINDIVEARDAHARRADELAAQAEEGRRTLEHAARELESEIQLRVEVQTALAQARRLETMGQLTSSVAHDFNNVLAAIVGSYSLIRRRAPTRPVIEIVEHGERAADRAKSLIRKLLAFARNDAPAPETLDLEPALHEVLDLVCHAAGERVRCSHEVWPGTWPVLADPQELGVAMVNLAVNARDAMPHGGSLTIIARNLATDEVPAGLQPGNYVSLVMRDDGQGMLPEVLARAQEAFFTTKPRGAGTGLGLSMVHQFAQRSGGTVRISSAPGAGTTVEIVLPRAAVVASTSERRAALWQISAPAAHAHGGASILLVEDDEQVRPITADFLRSLGYAVIAAPTAEAARVLMHRLPKLDLLIIDIALPGESGVELVQRLGRPGVPVLFITGRQPPPELGNAAILLKPFRDTALAQAVLQQLGREVSVDLAQAEPLLSRLTDPSLRAMLIEWHRAKAGGEGYPHPTRLDPYLQDLQDHAFVAVLESAEPPLFHYQSVGKALLEELERQRAGELVSPEADGGSVFGTLDGVYRRCMRTAAPVFQSATYDFGDGTPPVHFERLILPTSEDGFSISHLVGIVLFTDQHASEGE